MILGKKTIFQELQKLHSSLQEPFPYRDTEKIQRNYIFSEDACLNGDLNTYWMNILGTLHYVLQDKRTKISYKQIKLLHFSFFETFQQYHVLESHIERYPIFYRNYTAYERTRKLLLYYLS